MEKNAINQQYIPKQPEKLVFDCVGFASHFSSAPRFVSMNTAARRSQKI